LHACCNDCVGAASCRSGGDGAARAAGKQEVVVVISRSTAAVLTVCSLLSSCATEEFANASPEVAEDCRREVAILTDRDALSSGSDPLQGPAPEGTPDPIEGARRANEVAGGANLASWPEEALMYRCLKSRGVALTGEQAELLAEWEQQLEADPEDASGSRE
jgi:hypothetical protein